MIQEAYCSFEVSKLLKEKGFYTPFCKSYYTSEVKSLTPLHTSIVIDKDDETKILAPTHQMAMAWLREVHNIHIEIEAYPHKDGCFYWHYRIMEMVKNKNVFGYFRRTQDAGFNSYEETVEAALRYSLENLI